MMRTLLKGLRVLDLTRLLPGPFCTLCFADLGAEVLKIEDPLSGGDYLRGMEPKLKNNSQGFCHVNRNKKSMTLNLRTREGQAIFLKLVKKYDVLLESFRPGVMADMGLDYKKVKKHNPRLVYCSITGFGQTGPLAKHAGHDINFVSYAGMLPPGGDAPIPIPQFQIGDLAGGSLTAAYAILAGYVNAQRTKKGCYLDVSMLDGLIALTGVSLNVEVMRRRHPDGVGDSFLAGRSPCYQIYLTKDNRYMALATVEKKFWDRFLKLCGREDLVRFFMAEGADAAHALSELKTLFKSKTQSEWVSLLQADGNTCCSPLLSYEEMLEHPHTKARKLFFTEKHPVEGEVGHLAFPVKIDGADFEIAAGAPQMGQHTKAVLKSIGFKPASIEALKKKGVV